jgi:hypothetical protein
MTREDLTSIESFKKEELGEFWEKHTFTQNVALFKMVTICGMA